MSDRRQVDELASQCVALIVFDKGDRKKVSNGSAIKAEFRAIAAEASRCGIPPAEVADEVLRGLAHRFDPAKARLVHAEYLAGFAEDPRPSLIPRSIAD